MSEAALFPAHEAGGIDLRHPETERLGYDRDDMLRTAWLSEEEPIPLYRWTLHRRFGPGPVVTFGMLNPSTADALAEDPTIVKCLGFAARLGGGAIDVVNAFPWRATKPKALWQARADGHDITGGRRGNAVIAEALARAADQDTLFVAAWGAHAARAPERIEWLMSLPGAERLHALSVTKDGHPGHPLMLPYSCTSTPWRSS